MAINHFIEAQAANHSVTSVHFPLELWQTIARYEYACASCSPEETRAALDSLAVMAVHARRAEQARIDAITSAVVSR